MLTVILTFAACAVVGLFAKAVFEMVVAATCGMTAVDDMDD